MIVVGVIAPLVIAAAGIIAVLAVLPRLPYPLAVHWGPSGAPDRFGSPIPGLVLIAITAVGYSIFAFLVARSEHGGVTLNQRAILSIGPFLSTVVTGIVAGSTIMQVDVADPREGPPIGPVLAASFGLGLAAAIGAWLLLPRTEPITPPASPNPPVLSLGESERAMWIQHIGPSRVLGASVATVLVLAITAGAVALWISAPLIALVIYLVVMISIGAISAASLYWRVTIDAAGLRAVSPLGVPRFTVPLAEVVSADLITVDPLRDFGGWGIRWAGGRRIGIVMRRGEALEVRRTGDRSLVLTVPHAKDAAALLNSLAQRA
jgi:hypothetical protein